MDIQFDSQVIYYATLSDRVKEENGVYFVEESALNGFVGQSGQWDLGELPYYFPILPFLQ